MLEDGEVFAGYTIERLLGRGGMGAVYLAKHPRLPRFTALKLLSRDLYGDSEALARFEREADLAARLSHPGIVTVYDRGIEDGQPWISMQYVDGVDADSITPDSCSAEQVIDVIAETADALDYAHGVGILHRDVKPANILLAHRTREQREGVLLTDFGIARLQEGTALTRTGTLLATLAYASPEQLSNLPVDHRSDQYSLACTLFRLLTGTGAFPATDPMALIKAHLYDSPTPVRNNRPDLPPQLDTVLWKALAKRPDDRFATCTEFADAARRALATPTPTPAIPATTASDTLIPLNAATTTAVAARSTPRARGLRRFGSGRSRLAVLIAAAVLATVGIVGARLLGIGSTDPNAAIAAIGREFPGLAPPPENAELGVGTGYLGMTCYADQAGTDDRHGSYLGFWSCTSAGAQKQNYTILAYNSVDDIQAVISRIGSTTERREIVNSGTSYTCYLSGSGYASEVVTVFEHDPDREKMLMVTTYNGKESEDQRQPRDVLLDWLTSIPLNKSTATSTEPPR